MIQLLLHLIGDYITQSHWMATEKTKRLWPAFVHGTLYALPFLLIASWRAFLIIWLTHIVIDRFRLAKYVVWAKNFIGPGNVAWKECAATGNMPECPPFLAVWLMIIADNTIHLCINYAAIAFFGGR